MLLLNNVSYAYTIEQPLLMTIATAEVSRRLDVGLFFFAFTKLLAFLDRITIYLIQFMRKSLYPPFQSP
jgi:hypothetical protein